MLLAFAKKDKGGDDAPAAISFENTGIASVDEVFTQAQGIADAINAAQAKIDEANQALNDAFAVAEGGSISDALAGFIGDASDMLTFEMVDGKPNIAFDASKNPAEDVKQKVGALKGAFANLASIPGDLAGAQESVSGVVEASKGLMDVQKVMADAKSAGMGAGDAMKAAKSAVGNLKAIANLPGQLKKLVDGSTELVGTLTEPLKGLGAPAAEEPAEEAAEEGAEEAAE